MKGALSTRKERSKSKLALAVIILLSLLLRIWKVSAIPNGFFCDEASVGYNAYSILKSGNDEWGKRLPLFFKAFGEYKNPVAIYSSVLPIAVFGLSEFSTRLNSVLYGVLGVIAIYFLGKIVVNQEVGLISSLLLAISPWHVHLSRVSLEGLTPFVFFTALGTYFWLKYWNKKGSLRVILASIFFFTLALYSYFPARIFIPLFTLFLALMEIKNLIKEKVLVLIIIITAVLVAPLTGHLLSGEGLSRWRQVKTGQVSSKILHNYLAHFSPKFLFFKGDADMPGQNVVRHSVRGIGELYLFQLPLLIVGIIAILGKIKKMGARVLLAWLLFYPVGTIFTETNAPQATRSIIGVVPFQIISAIGLVTILKILPKKISQICQLLWILVVTLSLAKFISLYRQYPNYSSAYNGWQWGFRTIISLFANRQQQYDQLLISHRFNRGEELLKFYSAIIPCQKCLIASNPIKISLDQKQLIAAREEDLKELQSNYPKINFKIIETLNYPNQKPGFWIIEPQLF